MVDRNNDGNGNAWVRSSNALCWRRFKDGVKNARAAWRRVWVCRRLPLKPVSECGAAVIAPHPDDETFGCGGLIAMKRARGLPVTIIHLTDGEASLAAYPEIPADQVAAERRQQAIAATAELGVPAEHVRRLGWKDGGLPAPGSAEFEPAVQELAELLSELEPQEVYVTHCRDGLPDHEAAARLVAEASGRLAFPVKLVYYPVWLWFNAPTPLTRHVDFASASRLQLDRETLRRKQAAIRHYLKSARAPCGLPYCGRLPRGVTAPAKRRHEFFFAGSPAGGIL